MEMMRKRCLQNLSHVIFKSNKLKLYSTSHRYLSSNPLSSKAFSADHANIDTFNSTQHYFLQRRALFTSSNQNNFNNSNNNSNATINPNNPAYKGKLPSLIRNSGLITTSVIGVGLIAYYLFFPPIPVGVLPVKVKDDDKDKADSKDNLTSNSSNSASHSPVPLEETITNWSSTHEVHTNSLYRPETLQELEDLVALANANSFQLRPVGSAISPNGIGLNTEGMVNVGLMDKILEVDEEKSQVKVQAGIRVEQVVEGLRPYGLTLQNYASVREQQIGGFIQVSAHGTGMFIPPVDEQVVGLKVVTPGKGIIDLTRTSHPSLFDWFKCSLGTLGVVAEVTLQCVRAHKLIEHTFVTNLTEVRKNHKKWLHENKHLRYMWIPYTEDVVVVKCNEYDEHVANSNVSLPKITNRLTEAEKLKPIRQFYLQCVSKIGTNLMKENNQDDKESKPSQHTETKSGLWSGTGSGIPEPKILRELEINQLSFTALRDHLLALDPLNYSHVSKINQIESEYWKESEGYRIGWSDEILGFDCGGQQWVSEIAFPVFSTQNEEVGENEELKDIDFVVDVLNLIKEKNIAAPSPIEQRWSKSSQSQMSPVHGHDPSMIYSWVGIIMYLCSDDTEMRNSITKMFFEYKNLTAKKFWDKFDAHEHWAKIEVPEDEEMKEWLKERLHKRFPIHYLNKLRDEYDPKNILSNPIIDELFPRNENSS